ncbi:TPA: helix-turn-helix transcriptional regulator [Vibrio parahaemolyticus]
MGTMMISDVLKEAREKTGQSQSDVADKVGVTKQTYLKWENGVTEPKASQVSKLADVLGVTETEICKGKINKKMPLDTFIYDLSRLDPNSSMIALRAWEQVPDHQEFLSSLVHDDERTKAEIFQIV